MTGVPWLLVTAGLVALLTPIIRGYAKAAGMIDHPGPRRSHDSAVPRGGGLALLPVCGLVAVLTTDVAQMPWVFLIGALVMTVVGWLDDRSELEPRWRLLAQVAVALLAVAWLGPVTRISVAGLEVQAPWIWTLAAVPAMVWLINLFNFMDGSDGLAALQALISCALLGWAFHVAGTPELAWLGWSVAAACAGFLVWNLPPARIFLGDAGSLFLGWSVALLAFRGAADQSVSVWQSAIVTGPFVIDATLTLARRVRRGERWYTAHRDHAYQMMIRKGWSHRRVLVAWLTVNLLLVLPAFLMSMRWPRHEMWIAITLAVVLGGIWHCVQRNHPEH